MSLFDLNPKESPRELFGREEKLDELVRLIKARRWVAVLGPRIPSFYCFSIGVTHNS